MVEPPSLYSAKMLGGERLPDWPAAVAATITAYETTRGTKLTLREELSGKSGAFVAIADARGQQDGVFVIKIAGRPDGYADEATRHEQVIATGAFAGRSARLVDLFYHENVSLTLIEPSGKSFLDFRPLLEATPLFGSAYEALVATMWTPDLFRIGDHSDVLDVIRACLPYQLMAPAGGRVRTHVEVYVPEVPTTAGAFVFGDQLLPNPLHLVLGSVEVTLPQVRPLFGPTHGDCHPGNILIRATIAGEVRDLYLIDFASYRSDGPIFFDFAYYELATLLRQFGSAGDASWMTLVTQITTDQIAGATLSPELRGWAEDIHRGRRAVTTVIENTFASRRDDLKLQLAATSVAAGLAFLNKIAQRGDESPGLTPGEFRKAFIWSAVHLDHLLRKLGVPPPVTADEVPRFGGSVGKPTLAADEWRSFSNVDPAALNVLVLGEGARRLTNEDLTSLIAGSWNLIIDFGTSALDDDIERLSGRSVRQLWPGATNADVKIMARGALWYFANGRTDLTDVVPATSSVEWRRRYVRSLDGFLESVAVEVSPATVRALIIGRGMDASTGRMVTESLDTAFGDALKRIALTDLAAIHTTANTNTLRYTSLEEAVAELPARRTLARINTEEVHIPQRLPEGAVLLVPVPHDVQLRVGKDLTIVSAARASVLPPGRSFGVDFRRGMRIEWSELAQNIDVPRVQWQRLYQDKVLQNLEKGASATVPFLHEPSSGGTTIGRRIAWELKERFPVIALEQLTSDTADYIREIFQFTNLPVLVLMEADVVTESAREGLFKQLREDNTRAVFLWLSRVYDTAAHTDVVPAVLTPDEADAFLDAYLAATDDLERRAALQRLTRSPEFTAQKSPFFYGLTAFGERYVSLSNLIQHVLDGLDTSARYTLADLALVSYYSGTGFPVQEFYELALAHGDRLKYALASPFVVWTPDYVRIPHVLIAQKTLQALARSEGWRADLHIFAARLLSDMQRLRNRKALRITRLMETVFLTRDTARALADDAAARAGGIGFMRRFSPLIIDIGNAPTARGILERVWTLWGSEQPHTAVHFARHLLYEQPSEVDRAITVAEAAMNSTAGIRDSAVIHMVGTCYRIRMERRLDDSLAAAARAQIEVGEDIRRDFDLALLRFSEALELEDSEYGHISSVQTIAKLLTTGKHLAGAKTLADFLTSGRRWCMDALARAEEHLSALRQVPSRQLSIRAQRVAAEWDNVYGNVESVVSKLRALSKRYEDSEIRRALCNAIVTKHRRDWSQIPAAELREIVDLSERNVERQGVRDSDVRTWLRAYRHVSEFDIDRAVQRMADWHNLRPAAAEPAFYLSMLYLIKWLNNDRTISGYAEQSNSWLAVAARNRGIGYRGWGYEWLTVNSRREYSAVHFDELRVDPAHTVRFGSEAERAYLKANLARIEGVVRNYRGPQQADLDLGGGVIIRFTPREQIHRDDEGKAASLYVSFAYDARMGWDVALGRLSRNT